MSADAERGGTQMPIPFEDFVAARAGALRRTAYLLTRDTHLAEDLVQTVLAKMETHQR